MTFRPHHVAMTVKNSEESIQWYEEKLGFQVTHRYDKHGMEITQLQRDDVRLELFCYRKDLMTDLHVMGTKHLCIEVDDQDKTINELKNKNVEFVMDIDTAGFGGRYIFFKDCNGILVELYQP